MECLSPYLCMVTVPHIMVGLERTLDYRGVGLVRFHCILMHCNMYVQRNPILRPLAPVIETMFSSTGNSCTGILHTSTSPIGSLRCEVLLYFNRSHRWSQL